MPAQQPAADDEPAADPGAEDRAENAVRAGARAVGRLGQREAVGVVLDTDGPVQGVFQVAGERQIGRASCRERVCQYVSISGVSVLFKKKIEKKAPVIRNK